MVRPRPPKPTIPVGRVMVVVVRVCVGGGGGGGGGDCVLPVDARWRAVMSRHDLPVSSGLALLSKSIALDPMVILSFEAASLIVVGGGAAERRSGWRQVPTGWSFYLSLELIYLQND